MAFGMGPLGFLTPFDVSNYEAGQGMPYTSGFNLESKLSILKFASNLNIFTLWVSLKPERKGASNLFPKPAAVFLPTAFFQPSGPGPFPSHQKIQ